MRTRTVEVSSDGAKALADDLDAQEAVITARGGTIGRVPLIPRGPARTALAALPALTATIACTDGEPRPSGAGEKAERERRAGGG